MLLAMGAGASLPSIQPSGRSSLPPGRAECRYYRFHSEQEPPHRGATLSRLGNGRSRTRPPVAVAIPFGSESAFARVRCREDSYSRRRASTTAASRS